jgi:ATP-dependent Lon protease
LASFGDRGSTRREARPEDAFEVPAVFSEGIVLLPHMEVMIAIREGPSRAAIASAMGDRRIVAFIPSDGYQVGDVGTLAMLEEGDKEKGPGDVKLKGLWRIRVKEAVQAEAVPHVRFERLDDFKEELGHGAALVKKVHGQVDEFATLMPMVPSEVISYVKGIDSPGKLADVCGGSPMFSDRERLELLTTLDPRKRLARVSDRFERDLKALRQVEKVVSISDCEVCMDFADKAMEANGAVRAELMSAFLEHVVAKHPAEVLGLIAEKFGSSFRQRRSLR